MPHTVICPYEPTTWLPEMAALRGCSVRKDQGIIRLVVQSGEGWMRNSGKIWNPPGVSISRVITVPKLFLMTIPACRKSIVDSSRIAPDMVKFWLSSLRWEGSQSTRAFFEESTPSPQVTLHWVTVCQCQFYFACAKCKKMRRSLITEAELRNDFREKP